jgi:hypothetical protein
MLNSVPTLSMINRRLKSGRGAADADGGGAVYKGKKQNKRKATSAPDAIEYVAKRYRSV